MLHAHSVFAPYSPGPSDKTPEAVSSIVDGLHARGVVKEEELSESALGLYLATKPAPCTVASVVNSTKTSPLIAVIDTGICTLSPVRVFTSAEPLYTFTKS